MSLFQAADSRKMKYKQKWLILTNSSDENIERDMKMEFGNMHVRFDSDIKVVTSSLTIFDIYNTGFGKNGTLVINNYGFWNNLVANLIIDDSPNRYHKKSILSGVTLKSSTVVSVFDSHHHHHHHISSHSATAECKPLPTFSILPCPVRGDTS
ncbi:hypothetical protein HHI36_005506 [Cryptolaemus montrouzieri]|uniref:Ionotropic receptor 75a N-terminal domain-containing protein n=1 Tax=Cryptolaemus montrouzieri TaxID=559131 RepID=A0ABD2NUL7_9CUCU